MHAVGADLARERGVRADEDLPAVSAGTGDAAIRAFDLDAELLADVALERLVDRLARLDFAAGKLPVARVHLVAGALRKERGAVGTDQHRRGDIHRGR